MWLTGPALNPPVSAAPAGAAAAATDAATARLRTSCRLFIRPCSKSCNSLSMMFSIGSPSCPGDFSGGTGLPTCVSILYILGAPRLAAKWGRLDKHSLAILLLCNGEPYEAVVGARRLHRGASGRILFPGARKRRAWSVRLR